jgi:hypothetical protein
MPQDSAKGESRFPTGAIVSFGGGLLGTAVTIFLALYPDRPQFVVLACTTVVSVLTLGYAAVAWVKARAIPPDVQRRHRLLLANATDSQSVSRSARRTAVACYAMEVSQTEDLLEALQSLQGRLHTFAVDPERAGDYGDRAMGDRRRILDTIVTDCTFVENNHWTLRFLVRETCSRAHDWGVIRDSLHQLSIAVRERVALPVAQTSLRETVRTMSSGGSRMTKENKRQATHHARQRACEQSVQGARIFVAEVMTSLIQQVQDVRRRAISDLRDVL